MIDILIPTLGRPGVLWPLIQNILATTPLGSFRVVLVLDEDDDASEAAAVPIAKEIRSVDLVFADGTYPEKINIGYRCGSGGLVLPTADDVRFHEGWLQEVEAAFRTPDVEVVGTDDLSPATAEQAHATMPVLRRSYIDGQGAAFGEVGTVFHEGYRHNFCETELWQLACHRGVTAWAEGAVIEHLHPAWGKRDEDATDEKGNKQGWEEDEALFKARRGEWAKAPAGRPS